MGNCLVTKLKGSVNNPNLDYFDALQVKVNWGLFGGQNIAVYDSDGWQFGGPGCTIKVLSNGHVGYGSTNYGTEVVLTETQLRVIPDDNTQETEFLLIGLSKIEQLWIGYEQGFTMRHPEKIKYVKSSALHYPNSGTGIYFAPYVENSPVDLSFLKDCMDTAVVNKFREVGFDVTHRGISKTSDWKDFALLEEIPFECYISSGNVSELAGLTEMKTLNLRQPDVVGNITSFGAMTKLTSLNLNNSSVEGNIEDFVAAQYDAGKTTGSVTIYCNAGANEGKIKFNGATLVAISGKTVSWTSRTDIVVS